MTVRHHSVLRRRGRLVGLLVAVVATLGACGSGSGTPTTSGSSGSAPAPATVRLGYFPNVTHAVPIVADREGLFAKRLGSTKLEVSTFNAGPAAMEALKSGAVDATYVGPGPATNTFINSGGQAIRVVAGAASGGSFLVVRPGITSAADLRGKTIATPQLGNTQDIALRYWLKTQNLTSDLQGGGDVHASPMDNSQTLSAFAQKLIDGAWVPEPYATRLILDSGAHVLLDERTVWPNGKFAVTLLAVRTDFLQEHPDTVRALVEAGVDALQVISTTPAKAQQDVADVIATVSGKPIKADVLAASWKNLDFTSDPVASSVVAGAEHAFEVGILKTKPALDGLVDLSILNAVLTARGLPAVAS